MTVPNVVDIFSELPPVHKQQRAIIARRRRSEPKRERSIHTGGDVQRELCAVRLYSGPSYTRERRGSRPTRVVEAWKVSALYAHQQASWYFRELSILAYTLKP